jgi:hypothetical protein
VKIEKPDITNTSREYWEKVLESYGLSTRQLNLEELTTPDDEDEDSEGLDLVPLEEVDLE